ncbi:unnamed protein product, partial [Ectocarpus sp. 12 AP-2014]
WKSFADGPTKAELLIELWGCSGCNRPPAVCAGSRKVDICECCLLSHQQWCSGGAPHRCWSPSLSLRRVLTCGGSIVVRVLSDTGPLEHPNRSSLLYRKEHG